MLLVPMQAQPDDFTCGPASLRAVYGFFGTAPALDALLADVHSLEEGGTLAVHLGIDALRRGYHARLHSYNLRVFDPTWAGLEKDDLTEALEARAAAVTQPKLRESIRAYQAFLERGGVIDLEEPSVELFTRYFEAERPVLAGLSATYLYGGPRERTEHGRLVDDAVAGEPQGHFVVLCGFDGDRVVVADPAQPNPLSTDHYYRIDVRRLINAILLGVLTYDGNLLVLDPAVAP